MHMPFYMTFHDTCSPFPIRHPDRAQKPAPSLSRGVEGSRLGLKNKHRTAAPGFLHYAIRRIAPIGMTGGDRRDAIATILDGS